MLNRRNFMALNSAAAAGAVLSSVGSASSFIGSAQATDIGWDAGQLFHLLPSVNHDHILLKCSFRQAQADAPELHIEGRRIAGRRNDTRGMFWQFDIDELRPSTTYTLELRTSGGNVLAEPWDISTFPDPENELEHVRIGFYSCAGGHDAIIETSGKHSTAIRRAILERLVSLGPQAIIANGDQVYWDLWAPRLSPQYANSAAGLSYVGRFDPSKPIFGTENEDFILKGGVEQIAPLYGTSCRSIPTFFLMDDHDYYDNDEATDEIITFPPRDAMFRLARATQKLSYPEFLPDPYRPYGLPGTRAVEGRPDLSSSFGTLRYGKLLEVLLYDTRRSGTMHGPSAVFVDPTVEDWLKARMRDDNVTHVVNAPSLPPGWSKGNWYDWYPDLVDEPGVDLTKPKPYWQRGWLSQHDRLLAAMHAMPGRVPLVVSGDIHASGAARIARMGDTDLSENPVITMLPGTPGTDGGYHDDAIHPAHLDVNDMWGLVGANGFMIGDFYRDRIECAFYTWNPATQAVQDISQLEPAYRTTLQPII